MPSQIREQMEKWAKASGGKVLHNTSQEINGRSGTVIIDENEWYEKQSKLYTKEDFQREYMNELPRDVRDVTEFDVPKD